MRIALVTAMAALGAATAVHAAPASVNVTIGPELMAKAEKTYGVRDVDDLATELRKSVEQHLAKTAAYDGARIELVLADAEPNRPTFKQLGDTPGLSMRSISIGGATIDGMVITPDGRETPVHYHYYSPTLRDVVARVTWGDAEWTFDRFADRLAHGQRLASR
jgi:hypothetical protein